MLKKLFTTSVLGLTFIAMLASCGSSETAKTSELVNNPATAQNEEGIIPVNDAVIEFVSKEHDFGSVLSGDTVKHIFKFKNVGKAPLIIRNTAASCGCTVPTWPEAPIPVGGEGQIVVEFNTTNRMGTQNKIVTVTANTNPNNTELILKGEVIGKTDDGPLNH